MLIRKEYTFDLIKQSTYLLGFEPTSFQESSNDKKNYENSSHFSNISTSVTDQ